jgi:hypothetical protein
MKRRDFIVLASSASLGMVAHAQVSGVNDAINKAGRQRMLSQRMSKAWLALLLDTERNTAQRALDQSLSLFDRQHVELSAYAPNADIRATYTALEAAWRDYKALLVGAVPDQSRATALLKADARVLALAHQGTQQYEAASGLAVGKLVNIAGRQRMLSQRIAKFYLAATLPQKIPAVTEEIDKARSEFLTAMKVLRDAPEATARIHQELALADNQWFFFDNAIQDLRRSEGSAQSRRNVFVTSENLLSVMNSVTGLYAAIPT